MPIRGINHVTLCVTDLERSVGFYCQILGAVVRAQGKAGAYLELGDLWLCLEQAARVSPRADDSHIALDCAAAEYSSLAARIRSNADQWKENRSQGASIYFLDPDGHKLELHVGGLPDRLADYSRRADPPMRPVPQTRKPLDPSFLRGTTRPHGTCDPFH